ncbi:MAG: beta-lactamase family protein [archaeon]|nr:beta-lactamase family protein [archaeon]
MTDYSSKIESIDKIIQDKIELLKKKIPGMVIAIAQEEKLIYNKNYGYADIENQIAPNMDTVFRIGSITKNFTAIGIMQLWEQGKFKLDDSVNDYLPKQSHIKVKKNWPKVTFRHILTHTSGLARINTLTGLFRPGYGMFIRRKKLNNETQNLKEKHNRNYKTYFPPGSKYAYSNIAYSYLGYLIEILSGEKWVDYIKRNIMEPLEMKNSYTSQTLEKKPNEAVGYSAKKGKFSIRDWMVKNFPCGGIYSTANDMIKFGNMLSNQGKCDNGSGYLLKPETFQLMIKPHYATHEIFEDQSSVGYGFRNDISNGVKMIWHTGGMFGFNADLTVFHKEKITICVLTNMTAIFGSATSLLLSNEIICHLTGENLKKSDIFKGNAVSVKNLKKFTGYYGPSLGNLTHLTNMDLYTSGGDIKIKINKDENLVLYRFFGAGRKGIILYPTKNPLIFEFPIKSGYGFNNKGRFVFIQNEKGKIIELRGNFLKEKKNNFFLSARFFVYLSIISLVIGIFLIIL